MSKKNQQTQSEVIVTLSPSPIRRGFGIGSLLLLGAILSYVALTNSGITLATISLTIATILVIILAYKMHVATAVSLELRENGLYTSDGIEIAPISNVRAVELGVFAFKPSNGFAVILYDPMTWSWNPGLWWRVGKRAGIGGVTTRAEARMMAEAMKIRIGNE